MPVPFDIYPETPVAVALHLKVAPGSLAVEDTSWVFAPEQICCGNGVLVFTALGIVIVNDCGSPIQLLASGVIVIVAVNCPFVLLVGVKDRVFPVALPNKLRPIAILSLVQVNPDINPLKLI